MFRATRVKLYVAHMKQRGFPSEVVLAGSKILPGRLEDPDYMIDIWQAQRVIMNMITLSKDDSLGFEFGEQICNADLGIVGYAVRSCKTLSTAIDIWLKYSHPLVGILVAAAATELAEGWSLSFSEVAPMGKVFQFCVEENLTIGVRRLADLLGSPVVLSKLELSYPKPAHFRRYLEEFDCPITFEAGVTRMTVQSPSIDATIKGYDSEHFQACLSHCDHLLNGIGDEQPIAYQIRNQLILNSGDIPSLSDVAARLNFSPRNLSRRLKTEGVSYQKLVNDYRCDLAKEYVKSAGLSNKEIAYLLGYEETKAFLAAFKAWTGFNMSEYRDRLDGSSLPISRSDQGNVLRWSW